MEFHGLRTTTIFNYLINYFILGLSAKAYLFTFEEIAGIVEKHLFNAWVEDDARHGTFVAGVRPPPRTMGVRKINLNPVYSLSLVLFFGL